MITMQRDLNFGENCFQKIDCKFLNIFLKLTFMKNIFFNNYFYDFN